MMGRHAAGADGCNTDHFVRPSGRAEAQHALRSGQTRRRPVASLPDAKKPPVVSLLMKAMSFLGQGQLQRRRIVALALMLIAVGLLIAPSAYHRIAEHGLSTGTMQTVTGRCAEMALLPFAIALGLDLGLAGSWAFRSVWAGAVFGFCFALFALSSWFGVGLMLTRIYGEPERLKAHSEQDKHEIGPLHNRIEQMLTEARVILPGAQALLGFQLIIVLSSVFEKL